MVRIKKTILICTLFLILLNSIFFYSCKDPDPYNEPDKPELPPITMEGKGTFGFKVNGEIWLPFVETPSLFNKAIEDIVHPPNIGIQALLRKDSGKIWEQIVIKCTAIDTGSYRIPPPPWMVVYLSISTILVHALITKSIL